MKIWKISAPLLVSLSRASHITLESKCLLYTDKKQKTSTWLLLELLNFCLTLKKFVFIYAKNQKPAKESGNKQFQLKTVQNLIGQVLTSKSNTALNAWEMRFTHVPFLVLFYRDFIEKSYIDLKKANPKTPILIRECSGILPKIYARHGES